MDIYDYCVENDCVPPVNPASPLTPEQMDETSAVSSTLVDNVNASLEGFIFGTMDDRRARIVLARKVPKMRRNKCTVKHGQIDRQKELKTVKVTKDTE